MAGGLLLFILELRKLLNHFDYYLLLDMILNGFDYVLIILIIKLLYLLYLEIRPTLIYQQIDLLVAQLGYSDLVEFNCRINFECPIKWI